MPTCKVVKNANFTTISNYHLRDKSLSMKAKGLLTIMLSLPEDWDYTIAGLATLSADGRDSITTTIRELEDHGYVKRHQSRGEKGTFAQNEYWIYEMPQTETGENKYESRNDTTSYEKYDAEYPDDETACDDSAVEEYDEIYDAGYMADTVEMYDEDAPDSVYAKRPNLPLSDCPLTEYPMTAKTAQLNTKELNTKKSKIRYDLMRARAKERVEYAVLQEEFSTEQLDELIALIVEMESCQSETMLVAGAVYPREVVAARMRSLNAECIRYVLDCLREVKPQIKNIKKYLMASLFNAPATMESYIETKIAGKVFGTT